jgi:hypothetical protein
MEQLQRRGVERGVIRQIWEEMLLDRSKLQRFKNEKGRQEEGRDK